MLIKPQFGLAALPVGLLGLMAWRATGRYTALANALLGGVIVYAVVAIPLRLDPISFVGRAVSIAVDKPMTSLNAPNVWGLLVGYKIPDAPYALMGGALLLIGLLASLLPLRRRQDLPTILAVGLFLVLAFYLLPTRVHERYLFPALALLAPLAAANWRVLVAALLVTVAFTLTLLYALVTTTSFTLAAPLHDMLVTRTTVIWIALTLMATAATLVPLLLLQPRPGRKPPT